MQKKNDSRLHPPTFYSLSDPESLGEYAPLFCGLVLRQLEEAPPVSSFSQLPNCAHALAWPYKSVLSPSSALVSARAAIRSCAIFCAFSWLCFCADGCLRLVDWLPFAKCP